MRFLKKWWSSLLWLLRQSIFYAMSLLKNVLRRTSNPER